MSVELNHTIIPAKDKWVSVKFLADIRKKSRSGTEYFVPVKDSERRDPRFRYARRVSAGALRLPCRRRRVRCGVGRIRAQGVRYCADPRRTKPGEINYLHGGRGVCCDHPNGHLWR
jgi:hypothetical protein